MLRPSTSTPLALPVMLSTRRAIALGDRAKEISKVQRDLANSEALVSQEKEVLDEGIKQLVDALTEIVNGNFRVRIPFPSTQSLWPIAGTLNTIYARITNINTRKMQQPLLSRRLKLANKIIKNFRKNWATLLF